MIERTLHSTRKEGNGDREKPSGITRREFLVLITAAATSLACGACGLFGRRGRRSVEVEDVEDVPTPTHEVSGVLWSHNLLIPVDPSTGEGGKAFFVEMNRVFFSTPEGHPVSIDLSTGERLWEWDDEGVVYGTDAHSVYVVRSDNRLYALASQSGVEKWKVVIPEIVEEVSWIERPLWIGPRAVYLQCRLSAAGYATVWGPPVIVAVSKQAGAVTWTKQDVRAFAKTEHTLLTRDWGGADVRWRGLDIESGAEKWSLSPGWPILLEVPFQIADTWVYFIRRSETGVSSVLNSIVKMEIDSGDIVWESEQTRSDCYILSVTRNAVYVLYRDFWSGDSQYVALSPDTGSELWTWDRATYLVGESPPIALLSSEDLGYTWAVEISSGAEVWKNDDLRLNRLVGLIGESIVAVYNDPYNRNPPRVFGLDPATGQVKWQIELSRVSHKVIAFGDKLVYGADEEIRTIDPETGELGISCALPCRPSLLKVLGDVLLVQCGSVPSSAGMISAVRF